MRDAPTDSHVVTEDRKAPMVPAGGVDFCNVTTSSAYDQQADINTDEDFDSVRSLYC